MPKRLPERFSIEGEVCENCEAKRKLCEECESCSECCECISCNVCGELTGSEMHTCEDCLMEVEDAI
jgi:hypothetical protein